MPIVGKDLLRAFYKLFYYNFVIQVISEKALCSKGLLTVWEVFLYENNPNYNSYNLVTNLLLSSFLTNQKQESGFQQVCGLVMRNISVL